MITMKKSSQTLIEQLKISKPELDRRKEYVGFTESDTLSLISLRELIVENIDTIVDQFYDKILPFDEMDNIIGDAETLMRLKNYQKDYIVSLFCGQYDEGYVHSRLRVGMVHKRIHLDPKFFISAVHNLSTILRSFVSSQNKDDCQSCLAGIAAIEKIIMFDLSLVLDTYIYSLMDETRYSKEKLESYTNSLEEVIAERTKLLQDQATHDGLTELLNQRAFYKELNSELLRGQRRNYSTVIVYFDLDGFKKLNDTQGHNRGDEVLTAVAESMKSALRGSEITARYGGDEFCIILPDSTIKDAELACKRLCEVIKKSTEGTGITCSMGIAISSPENNYDANSLVKKADKAMYEAKKISGFSIKIAKDERKGKKKN